MESSGVTVLDFNRRRTVNVTLTDSIEVVLKDCAKHAKLIEEENRLYRYLDCKELWKEVNYRFVSITQLCFEI